MSTSIDDRVTDSLAARLALVNEMATTPTWALTDEQITAAMVNAGAVRASIEEFMTRLAKLAEDRCLVKYSGYSSTTAWTANLTHLSRGQALKFTRYGKKITPVTEATRRAWAAGAITSEQADVIASAIVALPDKVSLEERQRAEAFLLERSCEFSADDLQRLANRIMEVIDPDGADAYVEKKLHDQEQHALAETSLEMFNIGNGKTRIRGILPNAQAGILRAALEGIASPRRNDPTIWDRDGEHSDAASGTLTHPQRLGRAWCELIEHLPTDALPQHGGLAATVTLTMDFDNLKNKVGAAILSTGGEMSASQARRFACNAGIIPAVLGGKSVVLDLGRSQRLFTSHQKIALGTTRHGCYWRGCDRPEAWTEAHHVDWYSKGGTTDLNNAALFCYYHHQLLHNGEWDCRIAADGIPEVIPPRRIDPKQRPIRHTRFKT